MVCNFCGKENADDAVFCKACGNRLVSEEAPEELYTENISEEEYAESEEDASYAEDNTENSVIACANCGVANPAGNAFCGKCGKPFVSVCPKCGAKLADGQRFCGACGTAADEKSYATLGEAAGKFADYVKNISLPSRGTTEFASGGAPKTPPTRPKCISKAVRRASGARSGAG